MALVGMCKGNDIATSLIADALSRGVARGRPWFDVNRKGPHANGESLVHAAAQYGTTDIIELVLELKGDPNTTAHTGETALSAACRRGDTGVARFLLHRGADPKCFGSDLDPQVDKLPCHEPAKTLLPKSV